jgi:iron only hydrogenase large subunit-like protein
MVELQHGFKINRNVCEGRMHCMRACPTRAIRVKNGKAHLISELCIDCGSCLPACPCGAITATTVPFGKLDRFKFKVAVAAPALFAQFAINVTPGQVGKALRELGFDAVWEYSIDIELVDRAIADCIERWPGPFPLISNSCPVIVRLVQVAYPSMVEQLVPVEAPREIAAREIKRRYSQELGIEAEEIAAIYITPCQAKTISILQPAEDAQSYLDGAVGISEIYNAVLHKIRQPAHGEHRLPECAPGLGEFFHWGAPEGEFPHLSRANYLPIMGLPDVIKVFDDIEKGKIRNIEFLECHACQGGCIGGNLTVENLYAARSKSLQLISAMSERPAGFTKEVERRYSMEDLSLRKPLKPRVIEGEVIELFERVRRRKKTEELMRALPLLNCGLCGAPSCRNHAEDAAAGRSEIGDCVFISRERIEKLREVYKK